MKMLEHKKIKLPTVGQRMVKSAISVLIVYLIYHLRGNQGIPFYSAIAAIQCIQPYAKSSKKVSLNRAFGTFNGALFGMITILLDMYCFTNMGEFEYFALVSLMIIPVMY
ncbi:MAG: aromatic acid exporter family protein, partial [Eubacteriales bacterium]